MASPRSAPEPTSQPSACPDESGKLFKVVILKTRMTKPYTSVFLQLDCAYWNADSEAELRRALPTPAH